MRRLGRCRIGALCAFEYVCFVLLDLAERLQPAERCATIVNRFAKPSGQAPCALHPARTGRIAATALRHRRRSLRAALVHDLGHQADRLALCGHARSLSAAEAAARRAAPPVLQRRVSPPGPPFFWSVGFESLRSFLSCCCCSPCRPGSSTLGSPPLDLPLLHGLFCFSGSVGAVIPVLFGDAVHFDSPSQQGCCRLTVGLLPLREQAGKRVV